MPWRSHDNALQRDPCWALVHVRMLLLCSLFLPLIVAEASAESLILGDGSRIEGRILSVTATTIAVKLTSGGLRNLRRQDLAEIELQLKDGTALRGAFVGLSNQLYRIQAGDELLSVRYGELIGKEPVDVAAAVDEPGAGGPAARIEPADGRRGYVPPPIFVLHDGGTVVGRVQGRDGDRLDLRLATGGARSLTVTDIASVAIRESAGGPLLEGRFLGWIDGTYLVHVNGRWLRIRHAEPRKAKSEKPNDPIM